jgi:hypothetical protein
MPNVRGLYGNTVLFCYSGNGNQFHSLSCALLYFRVFMYEEDKQVLPLLCIECLKGGVIGHSGIIPRQVLFLHIITRIFSDSKNIPNANIIFWVNHCDRGSPKKADLSGSRKSKMVAT